MFDGLASGLFGAGKITSKCGNCGNYNAFGYGVGYDACYCSACGLNPYGKKKDVIKVKPKYKWSWKLNKAVRV